MTRAMPAEPKETNLDQGGFGSPIRKESKPSHDEWKPVQGSPGIETNGRDFRTNMRQNGGKPFEGGVKS